LSKIDNGQSYLSIDIQDVDVLENEKGGVLLTFEDGFK